MSAVPVLFAEAETVPAPNGALTVSTDGSMRAEVRSALALILAGLAGKGVLISLVVKQGRTHTRFSGVLESLLEVGDGQFAVLDWGMSVDMNEVVAVNI